MFERAKTRRDSMIYDAKLMMNFEKLLRQKMVDLLKLIGVVMLLVKIKLKMILV